jgi:hypothetical protein
VIALDPDGALGQEASMREASRWVVGVGVLLTCAACGEADGGGAAHPDDATSGGNGNVAQSGGASSSSGGSNTQSGGASSNGGAQSSGGTAPNGGSNGAGGSVASGGTGATSGSGATGGTDEQPDHPMYFVGDSAEGSGYALCELFSGDLVLEMPHSTSAAATHPVSGHALYYDYQTLEVRDVQANAGVGEACVDFVLSTTGEVLCGTSSCSVFRVDELENKYCAYQGLVIDAGGNEHPLSEAPPNHYALHTKPGGGFWLLGRTDTSFGRWSIAPDGTLTFDGEYAPYDGAVLNLGFALDGDGAAYASANIGNVGGVIRYHADFTTSEVIVTDDESSCRLHDFSGVLLSTP